MYYVGIKPGQCLAQFRSVRGDLWAGDEKAREQIEPASFFAGRSAG
jgi:hypothetical protein